MDNLRMNDPELVELMERGVSEDYMEAAWYWGFWAYIIISNFVSVVGGIVVALVEYVPGVKVKPSYIVALSVSSIIMGLLWPLLLIISLVMYAIAYYCGFDIKEGKMKSEALNTPFKDLKEIYI